MTESTFYMDRVLASQKIELQVAAHTQVERLAKSVVAYLSEGKLVTLSCIGAASISLAMKAIAIGNGEVAPQGHFLVAIPSFVKKQLPDREHAGKTQEVTALNIAVNKAPLLLFCAQ